MGSAEGGLFRFVPISPFSSDLFRFALLVFGNTLISDLFRFLPLCSDLISEQIRTNQVNPFLPTPFANPRNNLKIEMFNLKELECRKWGFKRWRFKQI